MSSPLPPRGPAQYHRLMEPARPGIRMRTCLVLALLAVGTSPVVADDAFEKEVRPLLVKHCVGCHGPDKQKAGLRLDTKAGWQTGGASGPAIRPGKPDESLLVKALHGK